MISLGQFWIGGGRGRLIGGVSDFLTTEVLELNRFLGWVLVGVNFRGMELMVIEGSNNYFQEQG